MCQSCFDHPGMFYKNKFDKQSKVIANYNALLFINIAFQCKKQIIYFRNEYRRREKNAFH